MRHGFLFGLSSSLIIGIIAAGKSDLAALLSVLDRILAKYPDYSDGYFIRAFALCAGNDRERALKSIDTSRVGKDSLGSLLSMRAKLEHTNGDYVAAVDDLDKAIRSDVTKATEFTNSSAVAPEKTASICTWTVSDMDAIVRRFPADYRSYLFRGLYFGKFAPLNEESLKPAIDNLSKAAELNSNSALTHFFKAEILRNYFFFRRLSKSRSEKFVNSDKAF